MQNPISTALQSILLVSDDGPDYDVEIFLNNTFCQFERIELEESVNNVFPVGSIIVRDLGDIVSYIGLKNIKKFTVTFATGEKYTWYITSVTYTNNMASEIDQTYVVIYFSNKLFYESQYSSFYVQRAAVDPETGEEIPNTATPVWHTSYPFVTTPEHIIKTYGKKRVFSAPEFNLNDSGSDPDPNDGCGVNLYIKNTQDVVNYVLFRPRIADSVRREQFQTNIVNYLNYIFTYAINIDYKPYYMFWTDFSNCLNYKFFDLKTDLETNKFRFDLPSSDPGQIQAYAIYDSADVSRVLTVEGEDIECKKIYVLVTNPAYSFNKKNYYYIRSNPLYMEDTDLNIGGTFSSAADLMSPFLSESSNTSLTTVTTYTTNYSPGLTYSLRYSSAKDKNLVYLNDKGYAGYVKDYYQPRNTINSVDAVASYENLTNNIESTPLGLRDSYNPQSKQAPLYPYHDNLYMWQYQFDITTTHPNLKKLQSAVPGVDVEGPPSPEQSPPISYVKGVDFYNQLKKAINSNADLTTSLVVQDILNDVTINKVLKAKYEAMKDQEVYDNERRELLIKTERENFVANVLCCIGKDVGNNEEWFFAEITGFLKDDRTTIGNAAPFEPLKDAWLYSWKKLEPGPYVAGITGMTGGKNNDIVAAEHNMFHGWTSSQCIGSTGLAVSAYAGFTGIDTWAINLNERINGFENNVTSIPNYRGPGYNSNNLSTVGNFAIKPIGFTGQYYSGEVSGSAKHIVKMYRIGVNELRSMGAAPPDSNFSNKFVYYFIAENALDGACNV